MELVRIHGNGTAAEAWASWKGLQELAAFRPLERVAPGGRAVVVAPHPDDEVLGTAGLMMALNAAGREIVIIAATDGTASHPGSAAWPPSRLAAARPQESIEALGLLGLAAVKMHRLGLPDGGLTGRERPMAHMLCPLLQEGDTVFVTACGDGHPDHEAAARAAQIAADDTGARLIEVPIWTWHWATPGDARVDWRRARRLDLTHAQWQRKRTAMRAFASQCYADDSTGQPPILSARTLERLTMPWEVYFE